MYSPKYNLVFIHNKKVAGTSFKSAMSLADPHIERRRFDGGFTDPEFINFLNKRKPALVTITRNPWDRFISAWRWCFSTRNRPLMEVLLDLPGPDLRETARNSRYLRSRFWYNLEYIHREYLGHNSFFLGATRKKETLWRQDHDFEHLTRQQHERFSNDLYYPVRRLNFENLEDEANDFFVEMGIPSRIPMLNTSGGKKDSDYRVLFTSAAREHFSRAFPQDSNFLGYRFDDGPGVPPQRG